MPNDTEFPVLQSEKWFRENPTCPRSVPWAALRPHEAQAKYNHGGQSLAQLAERGGLCPSEIVAVMSDKWFRDVWNPKPDDAEHIAYLIQMCEAEAALLALGIEWVYQYSWYVWEVSETLQFQVTNNGPEVWSAWIYKNGAYDGRVPNGRRLSFTTLEDAQAACVRHYTTGAVEVKPAHAQRL